VAVYLDATLILINIILILSVWMKLVYLFIYFKTCKNGMILK